jgi:hypothetical protein
MSETQNNFETSVLFEQFLARYKAMYSDSSFKDTFTASTQDEVVAKFLQQVNSAGPNFSLYHGTHSGFVQTIQSRRLLASLYLAVSPFQSAQYALQRAWTESGMQRLKQQPEVSPVLFELRVDLRGLEYEIIHPSLDAVVHKDIGIGISSDLDSEIPGIFEVQLVSPRAEQRLKQAKIDIVASGRNLFSLLRWSKEAIGSFPMDILLPNE